MYITVAHCSSIDAFQFVQVKDLPGFMPNLTLSLDRFSAEVPEEQRQDRPDRQQKGGLTTARVTLHSFLAERGSRFSQGISSPNTAWTTRSRLSPYLTWGHISHRHVIHALMARQEQLMKQHHNSHCPNAWIVARDAFLSHPYAIIASNVLGYPEGYDTDFAIEDDQLDKRAFSEAAALPATSL